MANHTLLATTLSVREVKLSQLRCHQSLTWCCSPGMNLLIGANGCGKTTLLESVYMMAHGRSFRQARDPFLLRHGEQRFMIHGQWQRFGPMNLSVAGRRGKTTLRLQGRDIQRRKDVSESFPVLVDAPQGRRLIDGAPGERRRWLDALVMTCFESLRSDYQHYMRALMQRARLLRQRAGPDELIVWEQQIVCYGMPIVAARQRLIEELNALLVDEQPLTEYPVSLEMSTASYQTTAWLSRLAERREEDRRAGSLRYGPHSDVVHIHFQQREIRSAGSRGQQRLASIAMKMAECGLWMRYRRLIPVLLLDDCLEALDQERQCRVLERLQRSHAQVLMTAPAGVTIPAHIDMDIQVLSAHRLCGWDEHNMTDAFVNKAAVEQSIELEEAA
ncbi:MAG: DNA replication and repair protein RecF [Mariprofundus sp.]